jgi:hypothetical protein
LPRRLELELPPSPRWPRLAVAASVVLHALLLWAIMAGGGWLPRLIVPPADPVVLAPLPAAGDRPAPLAVTAPRRLSGARRQTGTAPLGGGTVPLPDTKVPVVAAPEPIAAPVPAATPDSGGGTVVARRIAPGLARGKLWVEPLPLPPKELAQRLQRSHVELVDSAVTATIQSFLDSIAADPASRVATLPSWTTTIAGKKFGLDSRNIYIAGLKIPAAVLALLHLPSGNESKAFDRSAWLYDDLRIAAQRSANVEDFKRAIREIRERKEQERQFEQNQRTPPPKETAQ